MDAFPCVKGFCGNTFAYLESSFTTGTTVVVDRGFYIYSRNSTFPYQLFFAFRAYHVLSFVYNDRPPYLLPKGVPVYGGRPV
jgi:hypothetical protein